MQQLLNGRISMNNIIRKSVRNEEFEILASKGECYIIRFISSGYECRARKKLVQQGKVFDPTSLLVERESWVPHEEEFTTNSGSKFFSYQRKGEKIKIYFPTTNYHTEVYMNNARQGKVKDPLEVSVYGVGFTGVIDKSIPYWKQAKQLWLNMLKRCYSEKDDRGYLGRAVVDERWFSFENFLNDIPKLDGFEGWLNGQESGLKYNLDKDFFKENNDIYSRYLCCFLPESFNKALGKKGKIQ